MKKLSLLAGAIALALSTTVFAAPVHERIDHMEKRIVRGIKSGDLTRKEADRLRIELREIKQREHRMRSDGRLSERERIRLNEDLDRLDRHITRERRDENRR